MGAIKLKVERPFKFLGMRVNLKGCKASRFKQKTLNSLELINQVVRFACYIYSFATT